jgi:hypothetical protein
MELTITELDDQEYNYIDPLYSSFDKIPENNVPVKVIKKGKNRVQFQEPEIIQRQQIPIGKQQAKISRPQTQPARPQISYEDILAKMGMFVSDGKLHLTKNEQNPNKITQQTNNCQKPMQTNDAIPKNSYIYNKYFSKQMEQQDNISRPMNILEYRDKLIKDIIQKKKISQIKSTKLVMPTSNINVFNGNSSNLNKLFRFSQR